VGEPLNTSAEVIAGLSGLEALRAIIAGTLPTPAMAETLAFRLVAVDEGEAHFAGTPDERFLNPLGTVHGGWAATILDSALGCAVHSTLAPGERFTTLELKVNLSRAIVPGVGELTARGAIVTRGRRIATSEARLVDTAGRIYAHGTTTCMVFAAGGG
jgi:uncharacterized protein (TIGR00369 family)